MIHRILILIIILIQASFYELCAQNFDFDAEQVINEFYHLKTNGGMEQNSVNKICQDDIGQMWFSTKDGLIRYDSKHLKVYKYDSNDSNSIGDNFVNDVISLEDGNVWVATNKGISRYDAINDNFIPLFSNQLSDLAISDIDQDSKGNLWFIDQQLTLHFYNKSDDKLESFTYLNSEFPNIKIYRMIVSENDLIYITTNGPFILEFDKASKSFRSIYFLNNEEINNPINSGIICRAIVEDHLGNICMSTYLGFVVKYNPETKEQKRIPFRSAYEYGKRYPVMFIFEDDQKKLWVGTWGDGLYQISSDYSSVKHFLPKKQQPNLISNDILNCAFQDNAGYIWFGSEFTGINILKKNKKFYVLTDDNNSDDNSFKGLLLYAVKNHSSKVWIGADGAGLKYFDRDGDRTIKQDNVIIPEGLRVFTLMLDRKDGLWIGTNNGLFHQDFINGKRTHYPYNPKDFQSISGNNVITIAEDHQGNIWAGTIFRGLTKIDVENNRFTRFAHDDHDPNSLSYDYVSEIFVDSKHNVWVGTLDGLNKYNPSSGNFTIFKPNNGDSNQIKSPTISCIFEKDQNLWIGTKGGGLNKYNLNTKRFTAFTIEDGLPSNNVRGINSDGSNLWISTPHQISKFNIETKEWVNYTASDGLYKKVYIRSYGLQDFEFYERFSFRDEDGYLYFGGMGGMVCFHPDSLPQNDFEPPVIISDFKVNGEEHPIEEHPVVLSPNQNNLEISLNVLNYIQPTKNQIAYYLENEDENWTITNSETIIDYFDLKPGEYIFHYKGANNDGVWNEKCTPIAIIISPYFYQTNVFLFSIIGLFLIIIFAFLAHREFLKRKIEKQKRILRYSSSNLNESDAKEINQSLLNCLKDEQIYLEADLSLHRLAEIIETKPHYLSQVINQFHQSNFQEFINSYRIKEARELLISTDLKVLAVAYDSGFNSISTFNVAFKKEVGMSPSQYRKNDRS